MTHLDAEFDRASRCSCGRDGYDDGYDQGYTDGEDAAREEFRAERNDLLKRPQPPPVVDALLALVEGDPGAARELILEHVSHYEIMRFDAALRELVA